MATSIDWHSKVINILRADMLLVQSVPIEVRQLNIDDFRKELNDLSDDEDGMWADTTHIHYPPVEVAGVNLARVVQIINDYTVTFENGAYAVNITGGNSNIADVVNINNVSVRTANSAGLMDIQYMQAAAFDGVVAVGVSSIYEGTTFPVGTRGYPVNNLADAHLIANERGLSTFLAVEDLALISGDYSEGHEFTGVSPTSTVITIASNAEVSNCEFTNCTVQGVLDSGNILRGCNVIDLTHVNGTIENCALAGTVSLGGSSQATLSHCYSGIAGGGPDQYPYIDMGGSGNSLAVRYYSGGLGIKNGTGADTSSLDFESGRVVFDADCTGGTYTVRGIADVFDNSVGATIEDLTINYRLDESVLAEELTAEQKEAEHITVPYDEANPSTTGKLIVRNTRVMRRWEADAWQDADMTVPYEGKGLEAVGQLVEVAWS